MTGTVDSMHRLTREIAAGLPASTTQRAIEHVARALGVNYRRAYGFYYGTARSVSAAEWINAQAATMAARRARAARLRAELAIIESAGEATCGHFGS